MIIPSELRLLVVMHDVYQYSEDQKKLEYDITIIILHLFYVNILFYNDYKNWFDFKSAVLKYRRWFRNLSNKILDKDEDRLKSEDIILPIYFLNIFTLVFGLTDWDRYL